MSIIAIDLLVDSGLISSSGKAINLDKLSNQEVSEKISQYNSARIITIDSEIENYNLNKNLNALFSSGSTSKSKESILSSCLVYDSIILDDPLVSSSENISKKTLIEGLKFFEWAFELIKSNFLFILPLSFYNKPSSDVPLLLSDDAFKSSIPKEIHDFIHDNKVIRSVVRADNGNMLILNEDASLNRRPALNVGFKNDYWPKGVSLYLFQTMENYRKQEDGTIICNQIWKPKESLTSEKFEQWQYQTINQAMRCRLMNIYNETYLAEMLGHTYITESEFEAKFLSMSGNNNSAIKNSSARFLDANQAFMQIDSAETIIKVRDKYSAGFERFNYSLQAVSSELSNVSPEHFDKKAQQLFHKEIMPQIDEMRNNVGSVSRAGIKGSLGVLVGFSAAIATGSVVPLIPALMTGAAGALTEAFPLIKNNNSMKRKPAFIWHNIVKK